MDTAYSLTQLRAQRHPGALYPLFGDYQPLVLRRIFNFARKQVANCSENWISNWKDGVSSQSGTPRCVTNESR